VKSVIAIRSATDTCIINRGQGTLEGVAVMLSSSRTLSLGISTFQFIGGRGVIFGECCIIFKYLEV